MSLTITRPEKTVEFCTRLDLKAAHERADAALREAQREAGADARETGSTVLRDAAAEVRRLEAEMVEHTVVFTLTAWPRKRWAEWESGNGPRPGNKEDEALGFNQTSLDEVIAGAIISVKSRAGDDVPFNPNTDWVPLADEMTTGQWNDFATVILELNRGRGATTAPFSPLASRVTRRSEQTSKPPSV